MFQVATSSIVAGFQTNVIINLRAKEKKKFCVITSYKIEPPRARTAPRMEPLFALSSSSCPGEENATRIAPATLQNNAKIQSNPTRPICQLIKTMTRPYTAPPTHATPSNCPNPRTTPPKY